MYTLQICCVVLVTLGLIALPAVTGAATRLPSGLGGSSSWILYTPPVWFLGLYETIVGTDAAIMHSLSAIAVAAFTAVLLLLAVTYPIACWRALGSTSSALSPTSRRWSRGVTDVIVRLLARDVPTRGALQFTLSTLGRIQQHRLTIAIALGIAVTICLPIVLARVSQLAGAGPRRPLITPMLAIGPTLLFLAAAGIRVALALPSELAARWLFATVPSPALAGRRAARRVLLLFAVTPAAIVTAIVAGTFWTVGSALLTAAIVATAGVIIIDVHLWGFVGVPCARLLAPGSANLQARWPAYAAGLYVTCIFLPQVIAGAHSAGWLLWVLAALVALAVVVRRGSDRAASVNAIVDEDENRLLLLDLSVQPATRGAPRA